MEQSQMNDKEPQIQKGLFDILQVELPQSSQQSKCFNSKRSKIGFVFIVLSLVFGLSTIWKFNFSIVPGIKTSSIRSSQPIRDSSEPMIIRNMDKFENFEGMYEKTKFSYFSPQKQSSVGFSQEVVETRINLQSQNERKVSLYESNFEQYRIKADFEKDIPMDRKDQLQKHGFDRNIQLASNFDYLNITQSQMFNKVKSQWQSYFPYEIFDILHNPAFEKDPGLLQLTNAFPTQESLEKYILQKGNVLNKKVLNSTIFGLAVLLSNYPNDKFVQQIEYQYFNEKYKIGQISTQLPICVFSIGYNVKSKNKHAQFFESLERQNYTNYKLVIVDDDSIDGSAQFFYNLINQSQLKLRNRARIIHNLQRVGSTGNLIIRAKKFCDKDDIIVNIDTDDKFIGNQVFKTINAIYQNQNIWSAFSRFIFRDLMKNTQFLFRSTIIPQNYRAANDNWSTSHLKTYRHKIISKIPLEYFIQYHFNEQVGMLQPHFFSSASDRYMVYSIIELSGLERVFFIDAVFYYYYYFPSTDPNCYRSHQRVDQYKARIKTPLKKLVSLDEDAMPLQSYKVPEDVLSEMSKFFKVYQECLFIKKNRDLVSYQFKDPLKSKAAKLYNCQNFTLILSDFQKLSENISNIHAKTIQEWVSNNHSFEQKQELTKRAIHKCALVIDLQFESYMLHYPEFEYIIVKTEDFDLLEGHLNRYIKSKKLFNNVSIQKMEVSFQFYTVIKFYKKMESLETGAWNGNDPFSKAKYFSSSINPFLGKALIQFYTAQKSKKILDIGCGLCLYAPAFKAAKMVLTAYDGNPYTQQLSNKTASVKDFSQKLNLGTKFDWIQSFNVGEYIPLIKFDNFIHNLVRHANKGIILAWKTHNEPNEQTLGLRNPQTNNQIIKIMKDNGFLFNSGLTSDFRNREGLESFNTTLMIFKRK